jgi:micrococcal nuclease
VRVLILICFSTLMVSGCATADPGEPTPEAVVVDVIDGDTVILDTAGGTETVRLLGIDTPETVHPSKPVECFGPEASRALSAMLPVGTQVRLERDWESRDRYGRLLAYLHRVDDDLFVNLQLVVDGFADVLLIDPNLAYADELRAAVIDARSSGQGLWAACGGADTPLDSANATSAD